MRICVIGLGLIGASFAGALAQADEAHHIIGYDTRADVTQAMRRDGFIHHIAPNIAEAVLDADLVILAIYIQGILDMLPQIAPHLKQGALVMDVGSTKAQIVEAMNALPSHVQAVGGHPMTGRMTQQVEHASAALFKGCTFVLTPTEHTSQATQATITQLVEQVGARPLWMDAHIHDHYVAMISHLSRLLPIAVMAAVQAQDSDLLWQLAAGSFRETTRLGNQPLGFWRDVFATNTIGIPASLRDVAQQLERLAQAIENSDLALVETLSEEAASHWQRLYGDQDREQTGNHDKDVKNGERKP